METENSHDILDKVEGVSVANWKVLEQTCRALPSSIRPTITVNSDTYNTHTHMHKYMTTNKHLRINE